MSDEDPYVYPGTSVLKNRLGLRDAAELARAERSISTQRAEEGVPAGAFDLKHLQAIHRHLFQDVYDWAGTLRTVDLSKGESAFLPHQFIEQAMADVHWRITAADHFQGTDRRRFAEAAGKTLGDVNHVHPFREGNGRTQLLYLQQLATRAGHALDLRRIEPQAWIRASIETNNTRHQTQMVQCIAGALTERLQRAQRATEITSEERAEQARARMEQAMAKRAQTRDQGQGRTRKPRRD